MQKRTRNRSISSKLCHLFERLEVRTLLSAAPDLTVSIVNISSPNILVPGDSISVKVRITNVGDATATGTVTSNVYASLDTAFDGTDILLGSADHSGSLAPGASFTFSGKLPIQSNVKPGTYFLVVHDTSVLTVADTNTANDDTHSDGSGQVVWQFGNVGSRKNVKMTVVYSGQTPVTFALTGAGTGEILNPAAPISSLNVSVTDTAASSNLNITTPRKTFTAINGISIAGPINRIAAGSTNIGSGITVTGLARTILVNDIDAVHFINLNTGATVVPVSAKVDITAHVIGGCTVNTGGIPIGTFQAYQASDVSIVAPTVQKITLTDTQKGDVSLSGALTINQGGAVVPATAKVNITAGTIQNCTLNTHDLPIGSLTAYRATDLTLTAPSMQAMNVTDKTKNEVALGGIVTLNGSFGTSNLSLGKLAVSGDIGEFTLRLNGGGASSISGRSWEEGLLTTSGTVGSLALTSSLSADVSGAVTKATVGGDYSGTWTGTFGSLTIKGDLDDSLLDIGPHTGGLSTNQFNALTVKGWISNSTISAANPVGSITAGGIKNSAIRIGANVAFPTSQGDFEAAHTGTIKSLTITGMKDAGMNAKSFINSDIAAWQIGTLKVAFADTNNSGTPFGVASTFIKSFTYKPLTGLTRTGTNLTTTDSFTDGDFALRIV